MSCSYKASIEEHLTFLFIYLFSLLAHCSVSRWKWLEAEAMHFDQEVLFFSNDFIRIEEGVYNKPFFWCFRCN